MPPTAALPRLDTPAGRADESVWIILAGDLLLDRDQPLRRDRAKLLDSEIPPADRRTALAGWSGGRRGGAIKMANLRPDPTEIVVTEGPEDALSIAQELTVVEVWAALGTANMAMLEFPPTVTTIVIAGRMMARPGGCR